MSVPARSLRIFPGAVADLAEQLGEGLALGAGGPPVGQGQVDLLPERFPIRRGRRIVEPHVPLDEDRPAPGDQLEPVEDPVLVVVAVAEPLRRGDAEGRLGLGEVLHRLSGLVGGRFAVLLDRPGEVRRVGEGLVTTRQDGVPIRVGRRVGQVKHPEIPPHLAGPPDQFLVAGVDHALVVGVGGEEPLPLSGPARPPRP